MLQERRFWNKSNKNEDKCGVENENQETQKVAGGRECFQVPDTWRQPKVVIVGAGIAGLSVAHTLVQSGINDITILEATDR